MNTQTVGVAGIYKAVVLSGLLALGVGFSPISHAAQGCGYGAHRTIYGHCVRNYPGPWARPAPYHRGCWRNAWGRLRCY